METRVLEPAHPGQRSARPYARMSSAEPRGGLGGSVDLAAEALLELARELPVAAALPDLLQQSAHAWRMHQVLPEVQHLQVKMWPPSGHHLDSAEWLPKPSSSWR